MSTGFLPINRKEMKERGWDQVDFVYVIGDAYVDHPSFGHAIISMCWNPEGIGLGSSPSRIGRTKKASRCLESHGLRFLFPPAIWIPWSITILSRKNAGRPTRIHRAV